MMSLYDCYFRTCTMSWFHMHAGGGGISPGFSLSMTPDQLAQWLLQEYGEAYENDIGKMKGR